MLYLISPKKKLAGSVALIFALAAINSVVPTASAQSLSVMDLFKSNFDNTVGKFLNEIVPSTAVAEIA